jgi:LacI family transcriptional regulator
LGYVPVSPPSRQRNHVPTRIIGLFYEEIKLDEYWGFQTSLGLHDGAIEHNYDLLTMLRTRSGEVLGEEELRFLDRRSDGFIFLAPIGRKKVLGTLVKHDIPVVTAFTDEGVECVSSVTLDNEGAMKLSVQHLLDAGHRRIAMIAEPNTRSDFHARRKGFTDAVKAAGIQPVIFNTKLGTDTWAGEVLQRIQQREISAVVATSDYSALELMRIGARQKLIAPRDFSIIGMDNIPLLGTEKLTTISYSPSEVGRRAVEAINYRLAGDTAAQCSFVVPVRLEIRKSVGAFKKA